MNMRSLHYFFLIFGILLLSSCYKEQVILPDIETDAFNFLVTDYQEKTINDSRNQRLTFNDTLPTLDYGDDFYNLDQFAIRGESSLRYRRKGFSVNMDDNLFFFIEREDRIREIEKIKLVALVFDYTYIENLVAIEFLKRVDLWPLFSFYTELKLNDHTQGIYLLVEDIQDYFMYVRNSDFVFRRHYHNTINGYTINDQIPVESPEYYLAHYDSIYSYIVEYSGKQLYDSLMHLIDMPQYFAKLSIDMLLKNGDATDEIFFYTKEVEGNEVFGVCPWDYDDLFKDFPHEVGRYWGVGSLFGERSYSSMDDIIADVGNKLIFSIEDDLDYKIAVDDYLYQQYLIVLEQVLNIIDNNVIENVFSDAKEVLQPFYNDPEIVSQSQYDEDPTNQILFDNNLADKKQFLLNRRQWIMNELPNHIN